MALKVQDELIQVDQGSLHFTCWFPDETRGHTPIVLLHDALGSIPQWRDFPSRLAGRYGRTVIAYERRGYGRSSGSLGTRDKNYLHRAAWEELPALLKKLNIGKTILIGHSDGGSIALLYAAKYEATAVVSMAAHVIVEMVTLQGIRKAIRQREMLIEKLKKYHGHRAALLVDAWAGIWLDPVFADWDITGLLSGIRCPVLVLQGREDQYGTEEQVRLIQNLAGGPVITRLIDDCKHLPFREKPVAVLHALDLFFQEFLS